jgi:putative colanic acid biosynthesis UDP-glucose lipid carrier transferase
MIVNRRSIFIFRLLSDLLLLNAAFFIAAIFAQSLEILFSRNYMFIFLMGLNILWYFSSNIINLYDDFSSRYFAFQVVNIAKNIIVQALMAIIFIFLVKEDLFTRNFILYYSFLLLFFVSLRSLVFRKVLKRLRKKGKNIRNLLIIGAGEIGKNFHTLISGNPEFGYNLIGFLDNDKSDQNSKVIGNTDNLEEIIKSRKVDEVVIALPETETDLLDDIMRICNRQAVKTHIIPDYFKYISKKFQISMIGNFPVITVRNEPLDEVQWRFLKRIFDIAFSIIVLFFIMILVFPVIALIIKLSSKGPVFFIQERIGVKNRKFKCYKFRTLKVEKNAKDTFTPVLNNDPRLTRFGKFLRRSNIDEFPQFINVLMGNMSVVGPRPHAIPYDYKYGKIVEEIKLRHNVKPGITGWAQIHGLRGDVADEEENKRRTIQRIEYDLWYIENWSFWLDVQIILLTIWEMIKRETMGV